MKKINKLLIQIGSIMGVCSIAVPVSVACSRGLVMRLSSSGFDIVNMVTPLSYSNDNGFNAQSPSAGMDA
jgi:hypothetical protein